MGYEDRDYFKSKPKFEFASGLHKGAKALMIALIAAYVAALIITDSLEYARPEFWANVAADNEKARLGYMLFVLVPQNIIPIEGWDPGHWKLLTHWLVAPGIISVIIDVLMVYFVGKMLEQLLGTKRFLALFVGGCVISGALAALVDPWLTGDKVSVIMGPGGGILASAVAPIWIAPRQKSIFGWPLRNLVIGLVAIFAAVAVLYGIFGAPPAVISPTQLIWGAAAGAAYMVWLKKRGLLPTMAGGLQQGDKLKPWEEAGYLNDYKESSGDAGKFNEAADKQSKLLEKASQQAKRDKDKLDEILEKISKAGVASLSRGDKKFLDEQSKKK